MKTTEVVIAELPRRAFLAHPHGNTPQPRKRGMIIADSFLPSQISNVPRNDPSEASSSRAVWNVRAPSTSFHLFARRGDVAKFQLGRR